MDENFRQKQVNIVKAIKAELGDEVSVSVSLRRKIQKTSDFVMIYQEIGKKILEGEISTSTSKVFFYLVVNMSFENFIGIDLKSISDNINMPLRTVTQAMKDLKECGIIMSIKNNRDARRNDYRLNPIIAWKGKVKNKIRTMKENPDQCRLFEETYPTPTTRPLITPSPPLKLEK